MDILLVSAVQTGDTAVIAIIAAVAAAVVGFFLFRKKPNK